MIPSKKRHCHIGRIVRVADHQIDTGAFRKALRTWGKANFRSFPWRKATDPYPILMAEIMLHRTQASQVVNVYERFVECYPTLISLIGAEKSDFYDLLYPLGLRWRIETMHRMVNELDKRFHGTIPQMKEDLMSLSGISDYIASSVRCFAWNLPEALIDANTVRVTGRLFGLETKDSSRRNRQFGDLIGALVDPHDPRSYHYAMLDLAGAVCTKKRPPDCGHCPVLAWCHNGTSHDISRHWA